MTRLHRFLVADVARYRAATYPLVRLGEAAFLVGIALTVGSLWGAGRAEIEVVIAAAVTVGAGLVAGLLDDLQAAAERRRLRAVERANTRLAQRVDAQHGRTTTWREPKLDRPYNWAARESA